MRKYPEMAEARGVLAAEEEAVDGPSAAARALPARTIDRRRSLPGSRALLGGFLIAVAVVGTFTGYSRATATKTVDYVVAARDIEPGAVLVAADLAVRPMTLPADLARSVFTDLDALIGSTVLGPVGSGELMQSGLIVRRSANGTTEVSFAIEAARAVNGRVRPGESVDVISTYGAAGDTYAVVVAADATVVAVDARGASLGDSTTLTVTLAVPAGEQVLALTHAIDAGKITLVRGGTNGATEFRPVKP